MAAALSAAACTSAPTGDGRAEPTGPSRRVTDDGTSSRRGASRAPRDTCDDLPRLAARIRRGYVPFRSPDVLFVPREPNYVGRPEAPVHSGPWDYLAEVPLVAYGPPYVAARGAVGARATVADLAPTTAELIGFDSFPRRDGRVLDAALARPDAPPPRVVATVVWDGAGRNVLRAHPRAWPYLRALMQRGTSFARATIGSSPSVTPPVHTTIGTGAWPAHTGIPGITMRAPGDVYVDPFLYLDPSNVRVPTLADLYDRAGGNRPVAALLASANWHLGMLGHGAGHPGGDADVALLLGHDGEPFTNHEIYALPAVGGGDDAARHARVLDASDGARDGLWRGHDLADDAVRFASPANVAYQQEVLEHLIETAGMGRDRVPDLLYVNFKSSDNAGHSWGMTSPEVGAALRAQDDALRALVDALDARAGRGRWALFVTADHGQTPYPRQSGGWPIGGGELKDDVNGVFDRRDDGVELVDRVPSPGAFVRRDELGANGVTLRDIARWLAHYTVAENARTGVPAWYAGRPDDPVFDALMIGGRVVAGRCVDR